MEIELKRYVTALKTRLWLIVLIVAVACASAYFYTKTMNPQFYTATTKLIVNKTNEVLGSEEMELSSIGVSIKLIDTYEEIILTPTIMDKVVQRYPDLGLSSNRLISMITVDSLNKTQVMTLTATDTNYERAAKAVNAVSTVFQSEIPKIMKIDNVTILTKAKVEEPTRPFGQNTRKNVMITFAVALMLSIGLVVLLELLDNTIKSEEEMWSLLGVPSFATIPKVRKRDFRQRAGKNSRGLTGQASSKSNLQAGEQAL